MMNEEGRRALGLCSLENIVKGVSAALSSTLGGGFREDGRKLFSRGHSDRTRGNRQKLQTFGGKTPTAHMEKLLPHRMVKD